MDPQRPSESCWDRVSSTTWIAFFAVPSHQSFRSFNRAGTNL